IPLTRVLFIIKHCHIYIYTQTRSPNRSKIGRKLIMVRVKSMPLMTMMILVMVVVLDCRDAAAAASSSSSEKEIGECAEQLAGLATCLPYVGGTSKSPTKDCCGGLEDLLKSNKKCLCVVIKDRDDPQLGLHIDLSLAISLPSACNISPSPNISKCPELLHMAPNSPEAQVFYQLDNNNTITAPTPAPALPPAPSSGVEAPNVAGAISGGDQGRQTNNANKTTSNGVRLLAILSVCKLFFFSGLFFNFQCFCL
ncbi:Non-specific lipid transfer protein GPI-anchored 14, partial [Linum grandiflorum]